MIWTVATLSDFSRAAESLFVIAEISSLLRMVFSPILAGISMVARFSSPEDQRSVIAESAKAEAVASTARKLISAMRSTINPVPPLWCSGRS